MSNEEKIQKGTHVVVPKWERYGKTIFTLVSFLGFVAFGVRNIDLTFDNQNQKHDIISLLEVEEIHPITPVDAMHTVDHVDDSNIHMSFQEKSDLRVIKENQMRIGTDLKQLKDENKEIIRLLKLK